MGGETRWFAFGVDDQGKILGVLPIRLTKPAETATTVSADGIIVSVRSASISVSAVRPGRVAAKTVPRDRKPVRVWTALDFHEHFQERMKEAGFAYPGMSHKDKVNWEQLLGGIEKDVLRDLIDAFVLRHDSAKRAIVSLPKAAPSVGVLRGWASSIHGWVRGKVVASGSAAMRESPRSVRTGAF